MTSEPENDRDGEQPPLRLQRVSPGQSVLYRGKHAIVASNHPFYGMRLQAPEGGPTWYAELRELDRFDEPVAPAVPALQVPMVDPGIAECRRHGCMRTEL